MWPPPPSPPAPPSRVDRVPLLGTLLAVHGGLMLGWSAFSAFAVGFGALSYKMGADDLESTIVMVAYAVFAVGALPAGALQLAAGLRVRGFRGRIMALVSMWVGVAAFFLGSVFCFPSALGLLIFGHIVLLDERVKQCFEAEASRLSAT